MSKHNFFVNFLKKINIFINSLLEKKLNKLNFLFEADKLLIFLSFKRIFWFISLIILLIFSYLSLPNLYNNSNLSKNLKNQLSKNLNINFNLSENLKYSIFPKPHFKFHDIKFLNKNKKYSLIKEMRVYISIKNLFLSNNFQIKNITLDNVNFDLEKENYNFFIKLLNNNYSNFDFEIKNSNVFYRNLENKVLFINKIDSLKYFYDVKEKENIALSNNEIFNIPYKIQLKNNRETKKLFNKINLDFLNLKIKNIISYDGIEKNGFMEFTHNKKKSEGKYKLNNNLFSFNFFNKSSGNNFYYDGKINLIPFFSEIYGDVDIIDLKKLFDSNTILVQLLKSKLLNNRNLNIDIILKSEQIIPFNDLINLELNLKIKEGLIDINKTKFNWLNFVDFEISDSLLYVKNNNLILDSNISINIYEINKIYKFFQTPRNYRKEIKRIWFNFAYNFDQKTSSFNNIEIDDLINKKVNQTVKQFISKENVIQNKVYFKKLINEAIKSYAG